jgi:hypothetical protein
MSYPATVFDVMIASPGDVLGEREIARSVVYDWNAAHSRATGIILQPVSWDTHSSPSMEDRPQAVINKQVLQNCDLLVAIFWTRLGTPTGKAPSGTVEEIDEHLKQGKPAMIYFSSAPVRPESVNSEQYAALMKFRKQCEARGLVESFDGREEFRHKFTRQLASTINNHPHFKVSRNPAGGSFEAATQSPAPSLSKEAVELLLEAVKDPRGCVMRVRHQGGAQVSTNGKQFLQDENDARSTAVWEGAVDELEAEGLIKDVGFEREVYDVTRAGYDLAERLG